MNYLAQGQEDKRKIRLLLSLTGIGENMQEALVDHFARGFSKSHAAMLNNVQPGNLTVNIAGLNRIAEVYEKLKEIETYDQGHKNKEALNESVL